MFGFLWIIITLNRTITFQAIIPLTEVGSEELSIDICRLGEGEWLWLGLMK